MATDDQEFTGLPCRVPPAEGACEETHRGVPQTPTSARMKPRAQSPRPRSARHGHAYRCCAAFTRRPEARVRLFAKSEQTMPVRDAPVGRASTVPTQVGHTWLLLCEDERSLAAPRSRCRPIPIHRIALRSSHGDHDLASGVSFSLVPAELQGDHQGIKPVDDRRDLSGFDEIFQNSQVISVVLHDGTRMRWRRTAIARAP